MMEFQEQYAGIHGFVSPSNVALEGKLKVKEQPKDYIATFTNPQTGEIIHLKSLESEIDSLEQSISPDYIGKKYGIRFVLQCLGDPKAFIQEISKLLHVGEKSFSIDISLSSPHKSINNYQITFFDANYTSPSKDASLPYTSKNKKNPYLLHLINKISPLRQILSQRTDYRCGNFQIVPFDPTISSLRSPSQRISFALRTLHLEQRESIEEKLTEMLTNGYTNFFDTTRSCQDGRTLAGRSFLQKNYSGLISGLAYSELGEESALVQALLHSDYTEAACLASGNTEISKELKTAIETYAATKDGKLVLTKLPTHKIKNIVRSYLQWFWNTCASKRIEIFGSQVAVGDLVSISPSLSLNSTSPSPLNNTFLSSHNNTSSTPLNTSKQTKLRTVSLQQVQEYSIKDVVLPLLGPMALFPDNEMNFFIRSLLEREGINLSLFNKPSLSIYLPKSVVYRPVVVLPKDVQWDLCIVPSSPKEAPIIPCDLDRLANIYNDVHLGELLRERGNAFIYSIARTVSVDEAVELRVSSGSGMKRGRRSGQENAGAPLEELGLRVRATVPSDSNGLFLIRELLGKPLEKIV